MSEDIKLITKNGAARLAETAVETSAPANFIPLTAVTRHNAIEKKSQLDLAAVRAKLTPGRGYWRSLDELAGRDDFHALLEREFPHAAPREMTPLSRREFVRLMGASLALAGLAGCAFQPAEHILPYVEKPEELIPGKPLFYATAFTLGGYAIGVLAESHLGRPTKLEGNPQHPASHGATDVWTQAALLDLYDPERSQNVRRRGELSSWDAFSGALEGAMKAQRGKRGAGLRILTETVTSPTLAAQIAQLQALFPEARWHQYEAVSRDNVREGARLAFGEVVDTTYNFKRANVVVSLDANFLQEEPGRLTYARDFIDNRRAQKITGTKTMSRFYAVESMPTITGAMADNRLPLRASDVEAFARALGGALGVSGLSGDVPTAGNEQDAAKWLEEIAKDLRGAAGASIVIAGEHQPPVVHAIAHAINSKLGNLGKTVTHSAPVEANPVNQVGSLKNLIGDLNAGRVDTLLILGGNPAFNAPADLGVADALLKFSKNQNKFTAHLSAYYDETSRLCQWHVPQAHFLEAWGDARAYDGTITIQQPLIVPLYGDARSPIEIMATLLAPARSAAIQTAPVGYELVRSYWMGKRGGAGEAFNKWWNKAIHDGIIGGTGQRPKAVVARNSFPEASAAAGKIEITFRTDPSVWDGRFANNAWLQELPRPLTKLVWDNAAHLSVKTAEDLGLDPSKQGALLTLKVGERSATLPAWITPGHADNSITVHLGYGRTQGGAVAAGEEGNGAGFDVYPLRASDAMHIATVDVQKAGGWYELVSTQQHHLMDPSMPKTPGKMDTLVGRSNDILRSGTLTNYLKGKSPNTYVFEGAPASVYPPMWPSDITTQNQWKEDAGHGEGHGGGHGEGHGPKEFGGQGGTKLQPVPGDSPDGVDRSHSQKNETVPQGWPKAENYAQHQWGMSVDLNSCIGCNACTIACQAENNIATVGKAMVGMNREMHWLRIDTYYKGSVSNPTPYFQPMMCQHCEKAPCEPVCPVEATSHSAEGINEMTYNRCIGTKYCSNNCPYKVRRFNFLQFADQQTPTIQMMRNPDVTVRSRGVMEKCTFCVQRVNQARIQAEREDRAVKDGEVLTACQQVCPTNAIVFGNLLDGKGKDGKGSQVRQLREHELSYKVLQMLSTHPRVTYMAQIRNPNPVLAPPEADGGAHGAAHGESHGEAHSESH